MDFEKKWQTWRSQPRVSKRCRASWWQSLRSTSWNLGPLSSKDTGHRSHGWRRVTWESAMSARCPTATLQAERYFWLRKIFWSLEMIWHGWTNLQLNLQLQRPFLPRIKGKGGQLSEGTEIDHLNAFGLLSDAREASFIIFNCFSLERYADPWSKKCRRVSHNPAYVLSHLPLVESSWKSSAHIGTFWGREFRSSKSTQCSSKPSIQHCISRTLETLERKKVHGQCNYL